MATLDDYTRDNPPDSGSPSETFVNTPDASDVADLQLYQALPLVLREADAQQGRELLLRYLQRPQELFDRQQQKTWKIAQMMRYDRVPAALVDHLLTIVGWGRGSGLPNTIAQQLSALNKRKMIGIAVAYWKKRGRRGALADFVRAFTGVRPLIFDWFQVRNLTDELVVGQEWGPADVLADHTTTADAGTGEPDGEHAVEIRVPLPPNQTTWSEPAGYQARAYGGGGPAVPDEDDDISSDFVLDVIELARPMSERYQVAFVTWLDTFLDQRLAHWESLGTNAVTWVEGSPTDPPDEPDHPHFLLTPDTKELVNRGGAMEDRGPRNTPGWSGYIYRGLVRLPAADSEGRLWFYAYDDQTDVEGYYIRLAPPSTVELHSVTTAGGDVTLDTASWPLVVGAWFSFLVDIAEEDGGDNRIQVYLDGNLFFDLANNDHDSGTIAVQCPATSVGNLQIGPMEVYQRPLLVVDLVPS